MSSWLSDVATGLARLLHDAGIGVFDPDGTAGNIVRGPLPPDTCPGVGVQVYRIGADDPAHPTTAVRAQLWARAATPGGAEDLDAAIYDALQGLSHAPMGSAVVTDCGSLSAIPMGVDGNGNTERACNYRLLLDLPPTPLRHY